MRTALLNLLDERAELLLDLRVELLHSVAHIGTHLLDLVTLRIDAVVNVDLEIAALHDFLLGELVDGDLDLLTLRLYQFLDRLCRLFHRAGQSSHCTLPLIVTTFVFVVLHLDADNEECLGFDFVEGSNKRC